MGKFDPYKFIQEKKEFRPFNERARRDGNYDYIHITDVFTLIDRMQKISNLAERVLQTDMMKKLDSQE